MLLISVIKYLIVMPDVKDLAQAAQSAAAAPENVNVVEPTTSVNQPVQPVVDAVPQTPQVDTDNQVLRKWKPLMMLLNASVLMVIVM